MLVEFNHPPRAGFTLVEVLVAVLILAVGLSALAGTAAITTRTVGESTRHTRATALGAGRSEILLTGSCRSAGSGSDTRDGLTVEWSSGPGTQSTTFRWIVTVVRVTPEGPRADTVVGECAE